MIDIQMMSITDKPVEKPVEKPTEKPAEKQPEQPGAEKKGFIKTVMGYFRKE